MKTIKKLMSLLLLALLACMSINAQDTTIEGNHPPQFPGGDAALIGFINDNAQYPAQAIQDSVQGKVIVQLLIEKTGKVGDVKVLRSVREDLDQEAVRVVKMLPDFIPAIQDGELYESWYTVPVAFKLAKQVAPSTPVETGNGITADQPNYDEPPMFPGGEEALVAFIGENIDFSDSGRDHALNDSDSKTLRLHIDTTGKVDDVRIQYSSGEQEIIRIGKPFPDFTPAMQDGKPIAAYYTLPIIIEHPMFPGGVDGLMQFLANNVNYPVTSKPDGQWYRSVIGFTVDKIGKASDFIVLLSDGREFDQEAIRICKLLPDFIPGKLNGMPLKTQFILPVSFFCPSSSVPDSFEFKRH